MRGDILNLTNRSLYLLATTLLLDMNPIEEAFSKAKAMMKLMENKMEALNDIDTIVYSAFSTITVTVKDGSQTVGYKSDIFVSSLGQFS